MDCTFDVMRVVMREPAGPAPQPHPTHRAPVSIRELHSYADDLALVIEDMSEDGLTVARVVMELDAALRDIRGEIARRRGA